MSDLTAIVEFAQGMRAELDKLIAAIAEADEPAKPAPAKKATPPVKKTAVPAKKASPAKAAPEPEEPEEEDEDFEGEGDERYEELLAMKITALRALAIKRGFDENETKAEKDKTILAKAIWTDEKADPEDEDEDTDADTGEDDEEEAEEEQQFDRESLSTMGLRELKALARNSGYEAADLRGKDADAVIEMLLAEDEDAEEAEEEEEEEEDTFSEEDLQNMSLAELKALCRQYQIRVPRGADEDALIGLIFAAAGEDGDEE